MSSLILRPLGQAGDGFRVEVIVNGTAQRLVLIPGEDVEWMWGEPAFPAQMAHSAKRSGVSADAAPGIYGVSANGFESESLGSQHPPTREYQAYPAAFEEFWSVYPRKRNKRKALQRWRQALKRSDASTILEGAKRLRDDPNRVDPYTLYAERWLAADGWLDEPLPTRLAPGIIPTPVRQSPEEIAAEIAALGAEVE